MNRPYENIPRQGTRVADETDAEPTSSVRALDPPNATQRSKETRFVHVLLFDPSVSCYRIERRPTDGEAAASEELREIDRVPEHGDLLRLYDHLPDEARHAVFEGEKEENASYVEGWDPAGDWTHDGKYARVTIFSEAEEAASFTDRRGDGPSED
ncbi:MAG: hypothetical protein WD423_00900 [Rhodothermales bacterium]